MFVFSLVGFGFGVASGALGFGVAGFVGVGAGVGFGAGLVVGFGATGLGVVGAGVGFGVTGAGVGFELVGVFTFEGVPNESSLPSDCLLPFGLVIRPSPPEPS